MIIGARYYTDSVLRCRHMGNFSGDRRQSGDRSFGRRDFGGRDGGRGFDRGGDRPMYKAICSNCGKDCEVPFRPTNGKPVYCSDCFEKIGGRKSDSPRPERSDFRAPSVDQNKNQLDAISAKLDRILKLLEPKVAPTVVSVPMVEEVIETKAMKIKPDSAKASAGKKEAKKLTSIKKK